MGLPAGVTIDPNTIQPIQGAPSGVTIDPSTIQPIGGQQPPAQQSPSTWQRMRDGIKQSMLGQLAQSAFAPPENADEIGAKAGGGDFGLFAYRTAKNLMGAHAAMQKATGDAYYKALGNFREAAIDYILATGNDPVTSGHTHDAIMHTVSGGANLLGATVPAATGPATEAADIAEGSTSGGNLATPLTRGMVDLGTLALSEAAPKLLPGIAPASEAATETEAATDESSATHVYDPATKKISLIQQATQGEKVAQAPAQSALRTSAQEAAGDESVANNVAANPSLRTSLEEPIDTIHTQAKTLYRQIDDAAGTDFKALNDKLQNTNYQLRQLTETEEDVAKEAALEKSRQAILDKIEAAKQDALDNGVAPETLDKADQSFRQAEAMKDLEAKVFKNPSVVQGNARFGTPETVDVNKAVVQLQKLADKTEFGSSRLEQALGPDAAQNLLSNIYKAQRTGQKALQVHKIAKWAGISLGGAAVGTAAVKGIGALTGALTN